LPEKRELNRLPARSATSLPAFALGLLVVLPLHAAAGELAEVHLRAPLDEPRGYCIDMVGHKTRGRTDRPLHAHTCYSYQGEIAVDQGTLRALAEQGQFRFPYFDVCMTALRARAGEPLTLAKCEKAPDQAFELKASGEISPAADAGLCVTVAAGSGAEGGGGQPVHLRRALSLEPCSDVAAARQRWQLR
jgi:hypothetical protein